MVALPQAHSQSFENDHPFYLKSFPQELQNFILIETFARFPGSLVENTEVGLLE
jgi:hypothetical protein